MLSHIELVHLFLGRRSAEYHQGQRPSGSHKHPPAGYTTASTVSAVYDQITPLAKPGAVPYTSFLSEQKERTEPSLTMASSVREDADDLRFCRLISPFNTF